MVSRRWIPCCFAVVALPLMHGANPPASLDSPLRTVRSVGPEGRGNAVATAAWSQLAAADATTIPALLEAMDGANDYALNWLRSAIETIAQRESKAGRLLPVMSLEAFVRDPKHHPRARRMAYEMILEVEPETARKLLPGFINDSSNELRRDAVQLLANRAAASATGDKPAAVLGYRQALQAARDPDQIEDLARKLGELGEKVDLQKTFGWVTRWKLIGPFDNTGGAGFDQSFPPERQLDDAAEYPGKTGMVRWQDYASKNEYGLIDFNQPFTPLKGVTGYAWTEFWSETARPVELRLGCKNGWKVWLNGRLIFGRDEYHRAAEIDQYRLGAELLPGRNVLLVKCCQNEQVEDWTKEWEFQLRLTDAQGTPIASTQ